MIEDVEALMQHWGERCRKGLTAGGYRTPLASAIELGGLITGRASGTVGLAGSIDMVAEEVDAAIAAVGRCGQLGKDLERLARVRYLPDPVLLVEHQMRRLKIASERTYHDRVHRLHKLVRINLQARQEARA